MELTKDVVKHSNLVGDYYNRHDYCLKYNKHYYNSTKKKLSENINCSCGRSILKYSLNKHLKSKFHINNCKKN